MRPRFRPARRSVGWVLATIATLGSSRVPEDAFAQTREPSLLLGGPQRTLRREIPLDPRLPRGEWRGPFRALTGERSDSTKCAVFVQGGDSIRRRAALALLERACEDLWLEGFPRPAVDAPIGWGLAPEGEAFAPSGEPFAVPPSATRPPELFIDSLERVLPTLTVQLAPSSGLGARALDRGHVHCSGGALDARAAHHCLTEGLILSRAPATARNLGRGFATHLRRARRGASPEDAPWQTYLQNRPSAPLVSRDPTLSPSSAPADFFDALAARAAAPRAHVGFTALLLAATTTQPGALRFEAEPDILDVLRHSLHNDKHLYAAFFDALARHRFTGQALQSNLDGTPGPLSLHRKAHPAWVVTQASLPRNLGLAHPLYPTGSVGIRLELDATDTPIALRANCETPVSYTWSITRLGADDRVIGHLLLPYLERGASYEQRVEPQGARALLFVGTNLGGIDLDHPYDPDHAPHEPHGCSIYLAPSVP